MKNKISLGNRRPSIIYIVSLILAISILNSFNVSALGVAPSRKIVDYGPETQYVTARIVNNDQINMKLLLYAQGEYSEYVKIDTPTVNIASNEGEKEFTYSFKLPNNMTPGTHNINIIIMQVPDDMNMPDEAQTTILSTLSVRQQLRINVPYPGLYAEGTLYITEGTVNDTITFTANIANKGTEAISNINGELVIKGPTNEEIARIKSNSLQSISVQGSDKLVVNWKADTNPGLYYAEYIVNYANKQFVLRKTFMLGDFFVEIRNIKVDQFKLGTIAKFDVELVNKWNQPVDNVFADMQVLDAQGNIMNSFRTAPINIKQLSSSTITGYWDTKELDVGTYDIKVILMYSGKVSEKIFKTVVGIDSIQVQDFMNVGNVVALDTKGNNLSLLWILVIASIIFNIGLFIYFKFIRKRNQM
ncbi:TPA: hypothetical protein HA235_00250 [Candidatus Woesearchaeota archaeon]|nr:hypothetical protein [Candidatus Woesearchaeota archaeon]HIH31116.1 hypothetical protein [Candidatus Woesearchaeota archaeon]HIH55067.1 hypothetical protein [Candidatus Woesearchaeota archaeon]HIJ01318.1 hypothetical protein [Candidatus Woesearchaeota archaeon]